MTGPSCQLQTPSKCPSQGRVCEAEVSISLFPHEPITPTMADGWTPQGSLNLCTRDARYLDVANRGSLPSRSSLFFLATHHPEILCGALSSTWDSYLPVPSQQATRYAPPKLFHTCRELKEIVGVGQSCGRLCWAGGPEPEGMDS